MATAGAKTRTARSGVTEEFFTALAEHEREPLLKSRSGTLRFDITNGRQIEHWHLVLTEGDVAVSKRNVAADAVVRVGRDLFDGMVTGRVNAIAATLRGVLVPEGDLGLVILFQRLFPGPPRSNRKPRTRATKAKR
jgi:putative sterol carrier protein